MPALVWALAAASLLQSDPVSRDQYARAETAIPALRDSLDATLNDYPSARFREVRVQFDPSDPAIRPQFCGLVNAKNRFGAYIGWQPFASVGDEVVVEPDPLVGIVCDPSRPRLVGARDFSAAFTARR